MYLTLQHSRGRQILADKYELLLVLWEILPPWQPPLSATLTGRQPVQMTGVSVFQQLFADKNTWQALSPDHGLMLYIMTLVLETSAFDA